MAKHSTARKPAKPQASATSKSRSAMRTPAAALRDVSRSYIPPDDPDEARLFGGVHAGQRLSASSGRRQLSAAAVSSARSRMQGAASEDEGEGNSHERDDEVEQPETREHLPSVDELEAAADAEAEEVDITDDGRVVPVDDPAFLKARRAELDYLERASAKPVADTVTLSPVDVTDGDQLWDWLRGDADRGATLFGAPVASSLELHARLEQLRIAEHQGVGLIRAVRAPGGQLIGFAELNPMLPREQTALLTIYLAPALRDNLIALLPYVVNAMALATPYHLALPAPSPEWAELYRRALTPHGFVEHRMFVR